MDQQTFLRVAKRELGLSYRELAAQLGVSARTMEKWSLGRTSSDHRVMPLIARKFVSRLLQDFARTRVLAGDRATAETVEALVSHIDDEKLRDALHTFDRLQRSASALVPMTVSVDKPRYFTSLPEKNAWSEQEELNNARRLRKARASAR